MDQTKKNWIDLDGDSDDEERREQPEAARTAPTVQHQRRNQNHGEEGNRLKRGEQGQSQVQSYGQGHSQGQGQGQRRNRPDERKPDFQSHEVDEQNRVQGYEFINEKRQGYMSQRDDNDGGQRNYQQGAPRRDNREKFASAHTDSCARIAQEIAESKNTSDNVWINCFQLGRPTSEIDESKLREAFGEIELKKIDTFQDKNEEFVANVLIKKSDFADKLSATSEPLAYKGYFFKIRYSLRNSKEMNFKPKKEGDSQQSGSEFTMTRNENNLNKPATKTYQRKNKQDVQFVKKPKQEKETPSEGQEKDTPVDKQIVQSTDTPSEETQKKPRGNRKTNDEASGDNQTQHKEIKGSWKKTEYVKSTNAATTSDTAHSGQRGTGARHFNKPNSLESDKIDTSNTPNQATETPAEPTEAKHEKKAHKNENNNGVWQKKDRVHHTSETPGETPQEGGQAKKTQRNQNHTDSRREDINFKKESNQSNPNASGEFTHKPITHAQKNRVSSDPQEPRQTIGNREPKETKEGKELRETRGNRGPRETKEVQETRGNREPRETKEGQETRGNREARENRGNREPRETKEGFEPREKKEQKPKVKVEKVVQLDSDGFVIVQKNCSNQNMVNDTSNKDVSKVNSSNIFSKK